MAYGTAPRKIGGVWYTRTGRRLSEAGQGYWDRLAEQGRTDALGHLTKPQTVGGRPSLVLKPIVQKPKPLPDPTRQQMALAYAAGVGQTDPNRPDVKRAVQLTRAYNRRGTTLAHDVLGVARGVRRGADVLAGGIAEDVAGTLGLDRLGVGERRRTRTGLMGSPVPGVSPEAIETGGRITHGVLSAGLGPDVANVLTGGPFSKAGLALDIAALAPFGRPLRGTRALAVGGKEIALGRGFARAAERTGEVYHGPSLWQGAKRPVRTIQYNERVQQIPTARALITQQAIERPADWASRVMMGEGRVAGAARRVMPTASVEQRVPKEAGRQRALAEHRDRAAMNKNIIALPREGSVEDVAHSWYHQLPNEHMNARGLTNIQNTWLDELDAIKSGERHTTLNEEAQSVSEQLKSISRDDPEHWELRNRLGELNAAIEDTRPIDAAGNSRASNDLSASLARLGQVIDADVPANPKILNAMRALTQDREKTLIEAGLLTPEGADVRRRYVQNMVGLEGEGAEYLGHRLSEGRRSILPGRGGVGRVKIPQGLSQANELILARSGRLRQSTHVAAEDWMGAEAYRHGVGSREDLYSMGTPFQDEFALNSETHDLINPTGKVVPSFWKNDKMAQLLQAPDVNEQEIREAIEQVLGASTARTKAEQQAMIADLKKRGMDLSQLRVVPKKVTDRYYGQFAKTPVQGIGRTYDRAVDVLAASLIFGRLGYIPKNAVQNILMTLPHQGAMMAVNVPRAMGIIAGKNRNDLTREVYDRVAAEVGLGAVGTIGQEMSRGGVLRTIPEASSKVADLPFRISAFLHEAAAEGVISRVSPKMSEGDWRALHNLLTDPEQAQMLENVRSRSVEAMADFGRLTPNQRRTLRRLFIIPGWLYAGSRYPVHFAATHPGRSAALAYAAAGEPGADRLGLPQNRPITEYFAKGLPHYTQGIMGPGGLYRTGAISPYSTPFETVQSLTYQGGGSPIDVANPLIPGAVDVLRGVRTLASGESKKIGGLEALRNQAERLFPTPMFAYHEAFPPSAEGRMYSDQSRLGQLVKEIGLGPVKIDKDAALRSKYNQLGMEQSAAKVSEKIEALNRLKALGVDPPKGFEKVYTLNLKRQERLDKIRQTSGGLDFQVKAMRSDADMLLGLGRITKSQRDGLVQDAEKAKRTLGEDAAKKQIIKWRDWLYTNRFDGEKIAALKRWMTEQEKAKLGAAAG